MPFVWHKWLLTFHLPPGARQAMERWSLRLAWVILFLLLFTGVPLFLCMPLYADVTAFDLCARNLFRGGIHYRDAFDYGLPGMVWLHAGIRAALGWRPEVMRLVDFLVVAICTGLLVLWLQSQGLKRPALAWTAVVLFTFYLATPEVCHSQRDMWMLLPALAALHMRCRRVSAVLGSSMASWRVAVLAGIEGLFWGIAFWIKPFVAIPGLVCWLLTVVQIWRGSAQAGRVLAADLAGLLAALSGIAWLWSAGSWPFFLDTLFNWDYDYYRFATNGPLWRAGFLLKQFPPWGWIHLPAFVIAVWAIGRALVRPAFPKAAVHSGLWQEALLAGFYLGWLVQANYLQYGFLYHLAPACILALAVVAGRRWLPGDSPLGWIILAGFLTIAVVRHPLIDFERTALWARCCREGSSPDVQNRLTLSTEPRRPDWVALARVAVFLQELGLRDGELTCYSFGTIPLYLQLDLKPSTRFVYAIEEMITLNPLRQDIIRAELAASQQRYVVTDLQFLAADLQVAGVLQPRAQESGSGLKL